MTAEQINNAAYYNLELPFIKATEVLQELQVRCGGGQQYTTFPNQITDEEKDLVESKGYFVTRNYIDSENRDGAEPAKLYIGFQVALTQEAQDKAMVISQREENGIEIQPGGGSASGVSYNGTASGLTATNVQDAIDEVQGNVDNLPRPMVYEGTLGVGGEITELPAPSEANRGYTYKVITAGTYQGMQAKVGDSFISYATRWDLVPSGDEPEGTVTSVGVTSTDGSVQITGTNPITSQGTVDISVVVDNQLNSASSHPVQNKVISSILDPMSESAYDALVVKDKPLYFIYDDSV